MSAFISWLKRLFTKQNSIETAPSPKPAEPAKPPSEPKREDEPARKPPPWYLFALKYKGKKETDPEFSKVMVPQWKLVGLNLGTIKENWAAWCGLAMAVSLAGVGLSYMKDGGSARSWGRYGVEIDWKKDGIPQGAIIHINHGLNCKSSSSNHVSQANGDCTAADLLKPGATIDLYGGNQSNTWKVSTYAVKEICEVRWPKEVAKPPRITKSVNCSSKTPSSGESTR